MMSDVLNKLKRRWMKLRLQPIQVYCQHHVCTTFEADSMIACDWTDIAEFKTKIQAMRKEGVEFISLTEAYRHICEDLVRCKKYAVITFDDGYASLKEILPWLEEQHIPATLFINGKYLDGKSYRKNLKERYLKKEELWALTSPLIEIGSHGWEHVEATGMTLEDFKASEEKNAAILSKHPRYVPFYAYTYGKHSAEEDVYLLSIGKVPVLIDGVDNYNDTLNIHRILL